MSQNPRLLRPTSGSDSPASIPGLALWLDASAPDALYTTDAGPVTAVSSPLDISGCVLWLDGADLSSLKQNSDGTGAVAAGDPIGYWQDKSASAAHVTGSSTARPTLTANAVNGLSAPVFNGSSTNLSKAGYTATNNLSGMTRIAVCGNLTQTLGAVSRVWDGGSDFFCLMNGAWRSLVLSGGATASSGTFSNNNILPVGLYADRYANAAIEQYGGGAAATVAVTGGTISATTGGGNPSLHIGSNIGANFFWNGPIAEYIIFNRALTRAELASVEAYLASKWGISGVHAPSVTASGPVGYWRDRSGNGRHATQSTAASRPRVASASVNGRRVAEWHSSTSRMQIAGAGAMASTMSVFAVAKRGPSDWGGGGAGGFGTILSIGSSAAGPALRVNAGAIGMMGGTNESVFTPSGTLGVTAHALFGGTLNSLASGLYVNGALVDSDAAAGSVGGATNTAIGAFSATTGGGGPLNAELAEIISYNRLLSTAERRKIEVYLARRWGITLAPQVSNAEAQDWVNRVYANGGTVSQSTASAVSTMCDAIESAGIRDRFYRLNLFCGSNLNAALVPLYRGPTRRTDRNLLATIAHAVQVSGAGWLELSATKGALVAAPNGTQTAQSVTFTNGAVRTTTAWTPNAIGTVSLWARSPASGGATHIRITTNNTVAWNTGISEKFALSTSWQRISATGALSTGTGVHVIVGGSTITGAGDADCNGVVELWSPQLEFGSLSDYEGPQYGNTVDQSLGSPSFVGAGTDYAETGAGGGLTGNGTSKYLNTGFSVSNIGTFTSGHVSVYHGQSSGTNVNRYYMGANDANANNRFYFGTDAFSTANVLAIYGGVTSASQSLASQGHGTAGHRILSRTSVESLTHYHNGSVVATNTSNVSASLFDSTAAFAVFAANRNGTVDRFHNSWIAAYSIGLGLDGTQAAAYRTAMQAFQTALGRNV